MNVTRNNLHHFQEGSYRQRIGLFCVLFFLSAWLHAKDLLEIKTGRVTNCKCHVVDHLPNQKFMGDKEKCVYYLKYVSSCHVWLFATRPPPPLPAMDWSLPGSSVHGILQARIPERVAIPFSRGSFWSRDQTCVSCISGGFFTVLPPSKPYMKYKINEMWEVICYLETH